MSERTTFYIVNDDSKGGMYDSDKAATVEVLEITGKETEMLVYVDKQFREYFGYRTQVEKSKAAHKTPADALNAYCCDTTRTIETLSRKIDKHNARIHKAALLLMSLNAGKTEVTK